MQIFNSGEFFCCNNWRKWGVTIHYLTPDWQLEVQCLETQFFPDNHSAQNIREFFENMLEEWAIKNTDLVSITTDNATNMISVSLNRLLRTSQNYGLGALAIIWTWPSQRLWKFREWTQQFGPAVICSKASREAGREGGLWKKSKLPSTCHRKLWYMMWSPGGDLPTKWLRNSSANCNKSVLHWQEKGEYGIWCPRMLT